MPASPHTASPGHATSGNATSDPDPSGAGNTNPGNTGHNPATASNVDRITGQLRQMAAHFQIKPDARIAEGATAARLGVSRTPLREALNRLVAEGFLTFRHGEGFFCRSLTPETILDLYEARTAIEVEGLRLTVTRATRPALADLQAQLDRTAQTFATTRDPLVLLQMDEDFHGALLTLAGNAALSRMLDNLNGRIRYVRMLDLARLSAEGTAPRDPRNPAGHQAILTALADRDAPLAEARLRQHISLRPDQAISAVKSAFSQIYVAGATP